MSGGSRYHVTITVEDGGLLSKLDNLQRNGLRVSTVSGSSSPGGGSPSTLGNTANASDDNRRRNDNGSDMFKELGKLQNMSISKLIGIGTGIGVLSMTVKQGLDRLAQLAVQSSGQLQGLFKLWETSVMLIFKPAMDFLALTLRPISLSLFRDFIRPFVTTVLPWFRDAGKTFGKWLDDQQSKTNDVADKQWTQFTMAALNFNGYVMTLGQDLSQFGTDVQTELGKFGGIVSEKFTAFGTSLADTFTAIPGDIVAKFTELGTSISGKLTGVPGDILQVFTDLGSNIWNKLTNFPDYFKQIFELFSGDIWNKLTDIPGKLSSMFLDFKDSIWNGLTGVPDSIASVFTDFTSQLVSTLSSIPGQIRDAILAWLSSLGGLLGVGGGGGNTQPASAAGSRTQMAQMAQSVNI